MSDSDTVGGMEEQWLGRLMSDSDTVGGMEEQWYVSIVKAHENIN